MEIIDLPSEQEQSHFKCLEEWSPEMRDVGSLKEQWYRRMKDKGLRVKVARDEQENRRRDDPPRAHRKCPS